MNSKQENYMCCIFSERDARNAKGRFDWTMVREYGSRCGGHALHTWDCGERFLVKCKNCGKLLLIQDSGYHGVSYTDDSDYRDIYPVKSEEEAEMLNRDFDGYSLERKFERKALFIWNDEPFWHDDKAGVEAENPETIDFVRDNFKELKWASRPAEIDSGNDKTESSSVLIGKPGTLYYKNGTVRFTGTYEELEDGTERYIEGSLYREDGKLWMEGTFQSASLLRGKEYYPNGQLMFDGEYTNGKPHSNYGPPYPLNGVFYDEAGNVLYAGHIPVGLRGGVGYPFIHLPDGSFKAVSGIPGSHAGWDEKEKAHFRRTADFGKLPTFEEFSMRVEEFFKEYYKNEPLEKLNAFYFGDETQEMVRNEYSSVCEEWHSKDITENMIMHGSAGGLAYCLYMLY